MEILERFKPQVEQELREILPPTPYHGYHGLERMYGYHMGFCDRDGQPANPKGKYLRPALCLVICDGLGGDPEKALPAAASLELIHRTSLIFDDIQDRGVERNGQPTVWNIWGADQAINAGLALSCYGRLALQRMTIPKTQVLAIHSLLERAVINLCWGQYHDLSFIDDRKVQTRDYLGMVTEKTAALFGAACEIGAICAESYPGRPRAGFHNISDVREFGIQLGLAFQIHDDYLGIWGDEVVVGKTANDLEEKKRSLPVVMGLEKDPEQMGAWLSQEIITSQDACIIRSWMESRGIPNKVSVLEKKYALQARILLSGLKLKQKQQDEIEELLSFITSRDL